MIILIHFPARRRLLLAEALRRAVQPPPQTRRADHAARQEDQEVIAKSKSCSNLSRFDLQGYSEQRIEVMLFLIGVTFEFELSVFSVALRSTTYLDHSS